MRRTSNSSDADHLAEPRWALAAALSIVVAATLVAYENSLSVPFIFDDSSAIKDNPSIRALWPIKDVFFPPAECTVAGRPFANLTFAINYAVSGLDVRGYHATNLLLHLLSALTLFGIVRRTLGLLPGRVIAQSLQTGYATRETLPVAAAVATLWGVHPLLTESVTYISQRTEILMSFCYLQTLYAFIRAVQSGRIWWWVSIAACFAGVASKEGMVTAPVLVLLYDRIFVTGSFRRVWQLHRWYFAGLLVSWILLGLLLSGLSHRAVGFGLGVSWWKYALTECEAILLYLRLVLWPTPLVFDYGAVFSEYGPRVALAAAAVGGLLAAGAVAIRFRPRLGFLIAAFFLILSPTSSIVPVANQPIAENRVYLASSVVVAIAVLGLHAIGRSKIYVIPLFAAIALALQTIQRNKVYQSEISLWEDNIAKRPIAPRGFENLGEAYYSAGKVEMARTLFEQAVRIEPGYAHAHHNLGTALHALGDIPGAVRHFAEAVRLKPDFPSAHSNLGNALLTTGKIEEATHHLREAIRLYDADWRLKPDLPETHNSLGNALLFQGDLPGARRHYSEAIRLKPDFAQAEMNLGVVLREQGELIAAKEHLEKSLQLQSNLAEAHFNLGYTYALMENLSAAEVRLKKAVSLKPDFAQAHKILGEVLRVRGNLQEAQGHFQTALSLRPDDTDARAKLEEIRNIPKQP